MSDEDDMNSTDRNKISFIEKWKIRLSTVIWFVLGLGFLLSISVIVDYRNRALVNRIIEDPNDKIFITYGANHLSGVFDLLQQQDLRWKVTTVKWMHTIEMPKKHLEGKLSFE